MPLKATLDERRTANAISCRERRQRLLAEGKCRRCRQLRPPDRADKVLCLRCQNAEVQRNWRMRQRATGTPRARTERALNFETDPLIAQHMPLAKKLAWRVAMRLSSSSTVEFDDIMGDALYGLVVAGRTFNEARNVPFGAWATRNIRGAIYNGVKAWAHLGMKQPPKLVPLTER